MKLAEFKRQLKERFNPKREDFKSFIFLIVLAVFFFVGAMFFNLGPVFFIVTFSILFLILWFVAGVVIFRSLIAASVGLSLILFLAQSYCDSPGITQASDDALKSLLGFGLLYVSFIFIKSLWKELMGDKNKKEGSDEAKGVLKIFKEINGGKHSWIVLIIYSLCIGLFLWQLYLVLGPIVTGLCIYTSL